MRVRGGGWVREGKIESPTFSFSSPQLSSPQETISPPTSPTSPQEQSSSLSAVLMKAVGDQLQLQVGVN